MKKKLLVLLLMVGMMLALGSAPSMAAEIYKSGELVGGVTYELDTDGLLIFHAGGNMKIEQFHLSLPADFAVKKVIVEDGITTIGYGTFSGFNKMTEITLPDSVVSIGQNAFSGCKALTSIELPKNLDGIGSFAFQYCNALTEITIPGTVTDWGSYVFEHCESLTEVTFLQGFTTVGDYAFYGCRALTTVNIPVSVTRIGFEAFYVCLALTDVYYGGSEEQWSEVNIENHNDELVNATIHFGSVPPPPDPEFWDVVSTSLTPDSRGITFRWSQALTPAGKDPIEPDGYFVYRKAGDGSFMIVAKVSSDVYSYYDTAVINGVTYSYTVQSYYQGKLGYLDPGKSICYSVYAKGSCAVRNEDGAYGSLWLRPVNTKLEVTPGQPLGTDDFKGTAKLMRVSDNKVIAAWEAGNSNVTYDAERGVVSLTMGLPAEGNPLYPDDSYLVTLWDESGQRITSAGLHTAAIDPWGFSNTNVDTVFGLDHLETWYTKEQMKEIRKFRPNGAYGSTGLCFGMALASVLWNDGTMAAQGLSFPDHTQAAYVNDLDAPLNGWVGGTLKSYIQACHVLQSCKDYQNQIKSTRQDFEGMRKAVAGNDYTIIYKAGVEGAHALVAYAVYPTFDDNRKEATTTIAVYDPNYINSNAQIVISNKNDWWCFQSGEGSSIGYGRGYQNALNDCSIGYIIPRVNPKSDLSKDGDAANAFTDVKTDAYYFDAVDWAVANGITNGITETTFGPEETATRAQMVTFLWRARGCPAPQSTKNPFTDVKSADYYYDAVLWAVEQGITTGTTPTAFSPEATVTRAQAVTFLYRAAGTPAVKYSNKFNDVSSDAYYAKAVFWATEQGITNGMSITSFGPEGQCLRCQIVTFLWRDLEA